MFPNYQLVHASVSTLTSLECQRVARRYAWAPSPSYGRTFQVTTSVIQHKVPSCLIPHLKNVSPPVGSGSPPVGVTKVAKFLFRDRFLRGHLNTRDMFVEQRT